ncbi:MAG: homoserine O-acetyltransferase [Akkermansia sp.]
MTDMTHQEQNATQTQFLAIDHPVALESGFVFPRLQLAYETYGQLDTEASNAILLFHALTGSQHAHGWNPSVPDVGNRWTEENHHGWWDSMIGSGKPLDTDTYFIICVNLVGGCYGSTGPASAHPDDGLPWGSRFPELAIADQARCQALLLDALGIQRVALVGPSVGGLVALSFAVLFPDRVKCLLSIGSGYRASIEHRLSVFEQILAIELDPNFKGGDYAQGAEPARGLAFARIIGHKAFVYQEGLELRARQNLSDSCGMLTSYKPKRSTQSYMLHQGTKFARRFDANSYIRIADMWSEFDICDQQRTASFTEALSPCAKVNIPFLVFSIDTDCCFHPEEQRGFVQLLREAGLAVEYHTIRSDKGHDSFLLEPELYADPIRAFLTESLKNDISSF